MSLLFDHHLSPRLVTQLADLFPQATHVSFVGLDRASDEAIWTYAREQGYSIVTKDADFNDLMTLCGFPPKVVWVRLGNCTTQQIEAALRTHVQAIEALSTDPSLGILMLV